MTVEVFVKYQIIHKQWEGTAVLLISAGFTTKKQAPKDNISQALFHPPTFYFPMFTKTERGRSFQGWLAPRSRLSHACFQGTKSGQSIGHRNQEMLPEQMRAPREESSCSTAHLLSSCYASAHPGANSPHATQEMKRCCYREALSLPQ